MKLNDLRKVAKPLGVKIEAERDDFGWGYWLVSAATGECIGADDNFCTSLNEVAYKLDRYADLNQGDRQ